MSTKKEIDDKSLPSTKVDSQPSDSNNKSAATSTMAITETGDGHTQDHYEKSDNTELIKTVKNILYETSKHYIAADLHIS